MSCDAATPSASGLRVLVTRPRHQAEATAALLRRRGHQPLVDPILSIEPLPLPPLDPSGFAALVVTSANAVPALVKPLCRLPLYVVGPATAAAAAAAGWPIAGEASGDGASLAGLLAARLRGGRILHLGGADVADGLPEGLAPAGIAVEHHAAYRAVAAAGLPPATRRALQARQLDAVLLMSPRTARIWCGLVRDAGLEGEARLLLAACLSEAVATAARGLGWRELRIAASRDQTALVDSLDVTSSR